MTLEQLKEIKAKNHDIVMVRKLVAEEGAKLAENTAYRKQVLVCGGTGCTSSNSRLVIEALEKDMDALDDQLVRYRAMEKDAKSLAQDHVLTAELIERLIERIEIDHERNIRVFFRFKSEFQGEAVK